MLMFLVMGVTVANTSDRTEKIVEELDHLSGLLAVLFFAVHGTELDIHALGEIGKIGAIYIVCRFAGKWLGIYGASRLTRQPTKSVTGWAAACLPRREPPSHFQPSL
ncbi:MAG: cation:proton antiporter [Planctomycetaceae bacterium]